MLADLAHLPEPPTAKIALNRENDAQCVRKCAARGRLCLHRVAVAARRCEKEGNCPKYAHGFDLLPSAGKRYKQTKDSFGSLGDTLL